MNYAQAYWLVYLFAVIVAFVFGWPAPDGWTRRGLSPMGTTVVFLILLLIIGWKVFGAPMHDTSH